MQINQSTVDLVKRFEGLELVAYRDAVGVLTIGYGYTNGAGFGPGVSAGDVWTESQAEAMLARGLEVFASQIRPLFRRTPTENEFGAMLSLAYNIGVRAFERSTCLRRFNGGDVDGAADALTWFNKAGGKVLRGLTRRRAAERDMFLSDTPPAMPTPKADKERTSIAQSTTIQATATAAAATVGGAFTSIGRLAGGAQYLVIAFAGIALLGLCWIARERIKKYIAGDK